MRLLLIAYEFPPSPSPQSLRWTYLARELAQLGHEVHVLAPDTPGSPVGLPALPTSVTVHRVFAGPLMGFLAWRGRHRQAEPHRSNSLRKSSLERVSASEKTELPTGAQSFRESRLNWKGKLFKAAKTAATRVLFPDSRAEWNPWAKRELKLLLTALHPDAIVVSHEPASTIEIGMVAKEHGFPLIVDLGDPVLASYTPGHWKQRAFQLEADVCRFAEHVTVTCQNARELLQERHRIAPERCTVISQGFDELVPFMRGDATRESPLVLLYTGSFYSFRNANALLDAVMRTPGLVLEIAAINVPDEIAEAAKARPDRIRVIGFMRHSEVLIRQRAADVLVNISNADPVQVPGKLYEYLGAARPILHLGNEEKDAGRALVQDLRRGWICPVDADSIAVQLRALVLAYSAKTLEVGLDLGMDAVSPYSWRAQAAKFDEILMHTMRRDMSSPSDSSVLTNHVEDLHAE